MVDILIIEPGKEDGILNEIVDFISSRTQCRVTNLPSNLNVNLSAEVLSFAGMEVRVYEQTVCRDGELVPMSHHELLRYSIWHSIPDGYSRKNKSMKQCGNYLEMSVEQR